MTDLDTGFTGGITFAATAVNPVDDPDRMERDGQTVIRSPHVG